MNFSTEKNVFSISDRRLSRLLSGILAGLIFVMFLVGVVVFRQVYFPSGEISQPVTITIESGESVKGIATKLWERRLVRAPVIWLWYLGLTGRANSLQAGTYVFKPSVSPAFISRALANGRVSSSSRKFTVPPGASLRDLDAKLSKKFPNIESGELVAADQRFSPEALGQIAWVPVQLRDFARNYDIQSLEGLLAAETYFLSPRAEIGDFLHKSLSQFQERVLPELRAVRWRGQELSPYEVLVLASLLEKEVHKLQEKKIVAGILLKRLQEGMPLQVDATVNYVTGKSLPAVTLRDTEVESPYNTYRNKGLPPGPIANVSKKSVNAALTPEENPYFYYLSTRDGRTIYSETFKQHVRAKRRHLR